jgi:hypothetical protein
MAQRTERQQRWSGVAPAPTPPDRFRRRLALVIVALLALVGWGMPAGAMAADPEGGTQALRTALDEAVRGYLDAKAALDASQTRQAELHANLERAEANFQAGQERFGRIAARLYQMPGAADLAAVVASGASGDFLDRFTLLSGLAAHESTVISDLQSARTELDQSRAALEAEIASQTEQLAQMDAAKRQAESALWAYGGGQQTGGFNENSEIVAAPAPRNADGSWPAEGCSVYESITGGCVTPRTAHARDQAIAAGFNARVTCFRSWNDGGEHPKGRACDFAVGTGGDAMGADRTYGNSLAAFLIYNADRLGVLYVIWYRQMWLPTSGWRAFTGCCDSSSMHTDHVHLSVY